MAQNLLSCLVDTLNLSPVTSVSTLVVLFLGIVYYVLKVRGLPPGPTGVPLLGYWPFMKEDGIHLQLTELTKKYGPVYSYTVAGQLFIHIGSIKALKETHLTKSDCFSGRSTQYSVIEMMFGKGILGANGEKWKALRKFFVQSFKEFGLTSPKGYMSGPIYESINAFLTSMKAADGSPVNVTDILNEKVAAIFRRLAFNDGVITDEELKEMLMCYQSSVGALAGTNFQLVGDFARYFLFPRIKGYRNALDDIKRIKQLLSSMIRRHEQSYSEGNVRDMIDSYIKERNERRKKGDPSADYFTEDSLVDTMVQNIGDGIMSVAVFTSHFVIALLENPDVQEKIYREIVEVVGVDREVTLEDRSKLPYTNAFIQEVNRTSDFFPFVPNLICTKETTVNGYRIPKGSILAFNIWAVQHDPEVYDDPYAFKPSRYISQPGKPKAEPPVTFGVGKRACIGESYTMTQVFLFVTAIVKNFRLEKPKGYDPKRILIDGTLEVCAYSRK